MKHPGWYPPHFVRVYVGSLGDYPPMVGYTEIDPTNPGTPRSAARRVISSCLLALAVLGAGSAQGEDSTDVRDVLPVQGQKVPPSG